MYASPVLDIVARTVQQQHPVAKHFVFLLDWTSFCSSSFFSLLSFKTLVSFLGLDFNFVLLSMPKEILELRSKKVAKKYIAIFFMIIFPLLKTDKKCCTVKT